jgi:antitoxin component YwqK of YwqJK toxin-antitoxin module
MKRVPNDQIEYPGDGMYYHEGKPFTGIGYYLSKDGSYVTSEAEFVDGLESGLKRGWHAPGQLRYEGDFRGGVLHGHQHRWYRNGTLMEEGEYEFGIPLWEKEWDENGTLIKDYQLKETDANYALLEKYRRLDEEQQKAKKQPPM